MNSDQLREEFLSFFQKKGHQIVASSSLLPTDPSVLFTTAGMQQFKEYFLGKKSSYGDKVTSCQKCFRTSDIEEVGDERHLIFFEMLGNFSFGGYKKEQAIKLAKDFLDSIKIKIDWVTVFEGDEEIPRDEESVKIWKRLGFSEEKGNLKFCGKEDNFWGPTGDEGPCGPTTEIHSQGIEFWNIVFNQYYRHKDKSLTELPIFGVDTGMGLERLVKISQNVPTIFETDLFLPIMAGIPGQNEKAKRIIADHIKSAVFLIAEGILPSNVERGYILRRILRRAIRYGKLIGLTENFLIPLAQKAIEIYQDIYPEIKSKEGDILATIQNEEEKFEKTIEKAIKILNNAMVPQTYVRGKQIKNIPNGSLIDDFYPFPPDLLTGKWFFDLYQTFGFPFEMAIEELKSGRSDLLESEINKLQKEFEGEMKKHQEVSRAGAEKKFGGGGKFSPQLHTATHLLHAALREVLGKGVKQMGSDINPSRLRFDFSHPAKITEAEIRKVEEMVNQKIKEDLPINKEEMTLDEALKSGALAFFREKYPEKVTVYSIKDFSKEICAGPHTQKTGELGLFKIIKEESSGAGVRRIRAVLKKIVV